MNSTAAVFGDPHFYTFDNMTYTFNGKGEFVLLRADTVRHKLDVQARFEEIPNNVYGTARATVLTAVAGITLPVNHSKVISNTRFFFSNYSPRKYFSGGRSSNSTILCPMAISFRCDCRSALRLFRHVQPSRPKL